MKNKEKILLGLTCFLGGVVGGFLLAPIKGGICCANNNGNYYGKDEEENDTEEKDKDL